LEPRTRTDKSKRSPAVGWAALGLLVTGLVALVVWSLPGSSPAVAGDAASPPPEAAASASPLPAHGHGVLERPPEATCELAILTDKPEEEIKQLATLDAAAALLEPAHCGAGCEVVKKTARDREHTEIETQSAADYMLPPAESLDAVGATLTPEQRKKVHALPSVVIVRTHAKPTIDHVAARTCFALAQALGEKLSGLVYDETTRRIEDVAHFAEHGIKGPLGKDPFVPRHIVVQLYREDDGKARLLTLGMQRFGSPDFIVRGASMATGSSLANVVNAVASSSAEMKSELPFTVTIDDVARVAGKRAADLAGDAGAPSPVALDAVEAERAEGDPDNDIVELVPPGGAAPDAWDALVAKLLGRAPGIVVAAQDTELQRIATKARRDLPQAIARFGRGEGKLYVKGPFEVRGASDAGAASELMWIEVKSCDAKACAGTLANEPGYATNLAMGKPASVTREAAVDWMLELKDGGVAGGESIKVLEKRR
jgi:uncharacterized protein YegJ (DUF2314 family)